MNAAFNQFAAVVLLQRRRHRQRLYIATLIAALIALLLYQTQWPGLRSGLLVLLIGQAGDVLALLVRNRQLSKQAAHPDDALLSSWLDSEQTFVERLARFDTACHGIGFLALGYGFWLSTGNLWLALAIGIIYPAAFYLGISRRKNREAIRQLRSARDL